MTDTLQCLDFPTNTPILSKLLLKLTLRNTTGRPEPSYQQLLMSSRSMMILSSTTDVLRSIPLPPQAGRKSLSAEKTNLWSLRLSTGTQTALQLSSISRNSGLTTDMSKTKWRFSLLLPNLLKSSNTRVESKTSLKQLNSATLKPLSDKK